MLLTPADPRLAFFAPQPTDRNRPEIRLDRFPAAAHTACVGRIGPLANLRSSSGCAVQLITDSPWVELHLARLRHHQPSPCGIAAEILGSGARTVSESPDLRARDGDVRVRLATGLERGGPPAEVRLWLPAISTCALAGVELADGAVAASARPLTPRWLVLGDSLAQGFIAQSPLDGWVARLAARWNAPAWNLGVGGLGIMTEVFRWALDARRWELVVIALGSNHAWNDAEADRAGDCAEALAEIALAGGHGRVVWLEPPWKCLDDGHGPAAFQGVPLDPKAAHRIARIRADLHDRLAPLAPRLEWITDLMPHDPRLLPDGLHPQAAGFAQMAARLADRLADRLAEGLGNLAPDPRVSF